MQRLAPSDDSYAGNMPCALLIARPGEASVAQEALSLAGLRFGEPAPPHEARDRLSGQSLLDVLAVEASSFDEPELAELLPQIASLAAEQRTRVVVTLGTEQIDTVAGPLIGTSATLLCRPSLAERVAALATRQAESHLRDNDRPADIGEIARLSDEVERIARTLARLTGTERPIATNGSDKGLSAFAAPAGRGEIDAGQVRAAIRARRLREQFVDKDMLGEPGWDILLDLFAAELEQLRVSVSSLCIAAAVPPTTALRWITGMTEAGMLERHADPRDRRRAFVTLAGTASAAMRNYFAALSRQGLPFG